MEPSYENVMKGIHRLGGTPVMEASDGRGRAHETLKEMALWLLSEGNALNIMHWNVDTMNRHELLNEAYDLCRDTGDALAETYIAKTGKPCVGTISKSVVDHVMDSSDILSRLRTIDERMNEAVAANPKFTEGVKNIFADFDEKMTGIIYKYFQFKG